MRLTYLKFERRAYRRGQKYRRKSINTRRTNVKYRRNADHMYNANY